jgi:hypothetical protein
VDVIRANVETEIVFESVVTADRIVGWFSYHHNCQQSLHKDSITRTIVDALKLYGQLLPVGTMDCWPIPFVFRKTIRLTTTATTVTVAAVATNIFEALLAIVWNH